MKAKTFQKETFGHIRNNFLVDADSRTNKDPLSNQFQEILSMNGLSDINFK